MKSNYFENIKKYQAEHPEGFDLLTKEQLKQYQNKRKETVYGNLYHNTGIRRSIRGLYV